MTAATLSHSYVGRISRIPPPPPPPLLHPRPEDDPLPLGKSSPSRIALDEAAPHFGTIDFSQPDEFGQMNGSNSSIEAARHLERAGRGKGKDNAKRAAVGVASDDSSEPDIPIAKITVPPKKKRKVTKDGEFTIELERPELLASTPGDVTPATLPVVERLTASGRGRGKGRSKGIQREQSADSVSVSGTPKQRKKPGPKKKTDTLPPHTQEALGIPSASASVAGDLTPAGSRAVSPTPTNVSATFYELDEAIPKLKPARRLDDQAMLKRVKGLEEAQKKVWTNIARRDIVKVRKSIAFLLFSLRSCLSLFDRFTDTILKVMQYAKPTLKS